MRAEMKPRMKDEGGRMNERLKTSPFMLHACFILHPSSFILAL
jgi:hypothetical protein